MTQKYSSTFVDSSTYPSYAWASGVYGSDYARYVLDGDTGTYWVSNSVAGATYFYVTLGNANHQYIINRIRIFCSAKPPTNIDILGGNPDGNGGITWTSLVSDLDVSLTHNDWSNIDFANSVAYRYYQIKISTSESSANYDYIGELEFYGPDGQSLRPITKVNNATHTYTAKTTNGGDVPANAGDGDYNTYWRTSWNGGVGAWLKVDLGEGGEQAVNRVTRASAVGESINYYPTEILIEGSNNDSDWTTLGSFSSLVLEPKADQEFAFDNETAYRYYRITQVAGSTQYFVVSEIGLWKDAPIPEPEPEPEPEPAPEETTPQQRRRMRHFGNVSFPGIILGSEQEDLDYRLDDEYNWKRLLNG